MWRWFKRIVLAVVVFGVLAAIWAVAIEPGRLVVRDVTLQLRHWPAALSGYRIAFVTDIHAGSPHIGLDKLRAIVAETNALNADLILLGGDYVIDEVLGGEPIDATEIAPILAGLKARDGVYGVLGNHDNWNDGRRIGRIFQDNGIPMLEDRSIYITVGDGGFWLVGVSDESTAPHDVAKALTGTVPPAIVLTHSPDVFPDIPRDVSLTLSGHTHGGQVYVPFVGRPVVPSRYGQRYARGLIEEDGKTLFVSSGIGTSIWPVRFLTPPEIVVLTLQPSAGSP